MTRLTFQLLGNFLRFAAAVILAGGGLAAADGVGIKSERLLAAILKYAPEPTLVAPGEQFKRAEQAAMQILQGEAFFGVGHSMEPLYATETAIVVAPIRFSELKKGMTVLYMNRRGRMVAHSLVGDLPRGWIAQGVANAEEDDDLVTRDNLIGIIVEAYAAAPSDVRVALTKDLVAKGRLEANRG